MSAEQLQLECCICMDSIVNKNTNCVTTECGHTFHTNCLMANVSHNGFGCPYCRQAMAEDKDDDESETLSDYETIESEPELYNDYALTSMRWMFQREEDGEVSNDEETDDNDDNDENSNEVTEEENIIRPSINLIAEKLSQRGTTYEDLIQAYLSLVSFDEYEGDLQDDFIRKEGAIFRKIKNIIREYRRQEETRVIGGGIPIQRGIDIGRENIPDVLYVPENSQVSSQVNVLQQFGRTHSYL